MKLTRICGQPSWRVGCDVVEAAVTRQGGHLGPVRFRLPHATVEPFSVAPWAEETSAAKLPPLLRALRGDFFCAPFGGNERALRGERHPPHGETANARWNFVSLAASDSETRLRLALETKIRPGQVEKMICLRRGETAVYCRHIVSGMKGRMNLGHHAMLKFPDAEGSGLIDTSPITFGQVLPVAFEDASKGGYSSLRPGAEFSNLARVPAANGAMADLSRYPARRGFEDLVMLAHQASAEFAWTAVTFPAQRYVWFALKDPRVLRSTVFWISNGGRHYAPWNGRHVGVMGLEDVTAHFHLGLADSVRPNAVSRRGIATCVALDSRRPLTVNYIMAVAAIPANWGRVKAITPDEQGVVLRSSRNRRLRVPLEVNFLYTKAS